MAQLTEVARWEWRLGDVGEPGRLLQEFVVSRGIPADTLAILGQQYRAGLPAQLRDRRVAILISAAGASAIAGLTPAPSGASRPANPTPRLPDVAAVVYMPQPTPVNPPQRVPGEYELGEWVPSWSPAEHRRAVEKVRDAIAAGELYQANMVGHASVPYSGDPIAGLQAVAKLPGATYGQVLTGDGWVVATGSSESLLHVSEGLIRTRPIKGTRARTRAGRRELLTSEKERAEHIMIVDMARNDISHVAEIGSVVVERLFTPQPWCQLWQAESTVRAQLLPAANLVDVLRALAPAASVTGAPKKAALSLIDELEPVGRGPSMGVMGWLSPAALKLAVTIRTVAAVDGRLHAWAGGGITWGSDPAAEVAEAAEKIQPICTVL
ncbi:MAG: chorismate-binding protein [Mycobacteriales bacterium]